MWTRGWHIGHLGKGTEKEPLRWWRMKGLKLKVRQGLLSVREKTEPVALRVCIFSEPLFGGMRGGWDQGRALDRCWRL